MNSIQIKPWGFVLGITIMLSMVSSISVLAQVKLHFTTESIASTPIEISERLTTNLIFPQPIKSVDRGSRSILVQRASEAENILQVKSENTELQISNLTVITDDGQFYSFAVSYAKAPEQLNLNILPKTTSQLAEFPVGQISEAEVREIAKKVSVKNRRIKPIRQRKYMTGVSLIGIYIAQDLLFFQIKLENQTNINYDIEQFRFFIRDNQKSKRTASQELEQIPIKILGNIDQIPAQSTETLVVALHKFTIPDQKHLGIELMEHNGGRHLNIKVKNHNIINAVMVD
ncbi:conjugative transposon TraN protein [Algoriphagus ratkowskyi]|uniref:Conjugative transposon TraN protein n=1 Tax=Algoriphagus ratkowskyi TaxID=57028 RepID=A0A2W7QSF5_9BACT|nr:conjugative transposon protein TraN [Algoriphagus ratkowskyi]PZX51503.1 conjugative transposon TraN protein [Algoriphagus ratkowskyi]TXD78786.1 conjugative transposon protein TraN [Algoriphagus ratkowskyi]